MSTGSAILFTPGKIINDWRLDYNECRPHSSLNYLTPAEFAAGWRNGKYEEKPTDITN
jgi:putative transposase